MECKVCLLRANDAEVRRASIRSNVRAHRHECFPIWRCPHCGSVHSAQEVDLDYYYQGYPYSVYRRDFIRYFIFQRQMTRLRRLGMARNSSLLDYGTGSGIFIDYLRQYGYPNAVGYDPYEGRFKDRQIIEQQYDFVHAQDVIEHAEDPDEVFSDMLMLVRPGGILYIGTPDGGAVDFSRLEDSLHSLHQPYHRHLLSRHGMRLLGERHGASLLSIERAPHDTAFPFVNLRFFRFYAAKTDDVLDVGFEPYHLGPAIFTPRGLFLAFFGSFLSPSSEMACIYRKASP